MGEQRVVVVPAFCLANIERVRLEIPYAVEVDPEVTFEVGPRVLGERDVSAVEFGDLLEVVTAAAAGDNDEGERDTADDVCDVLHDGSPVECGMYFQHVISFCYEVCYNIIIHQR